MSGLQNCSETASREVGKLASLLKSLVEVSYDYLVWILDVQLSFAVC